MLTYISATGAEYKSMMEALEATSDPLASSKSLHVEKSVPTKEYLKNNKNIDITSKKYKKALFNAEEATNMVPNKSENWIDYATLLLYMTNVQDAQISAEVAAKIALSLDENSFDEAHMILLQSHVNQFDFSNAILTMDSLLEKEPILLNHLPLVGTFVKIYAFGGEVERGIAYLDNFLIRYPSSYGAIIANIKLHKIELKSSSNRSDIYNKIDELKADLKYIYRSSKNGSLSKVQADIESVWEKL